MKEKSMQSIQPIIDSGIIACVASMNPERRGSCLEFEPALSVIRETRSGGIVYHLPGTSTSAEDFRAFTWSLFDLVRALGPRHAFVLLANTSRARDADHAVRMAIDSSAIYKHLPHPPAQTQAIIKLEVLTPDLYSLDSEVVGALRALVRNYDLTVIPLVSPRHEVVLECAELGAPAVRILVGRIGGCEGPKHLDRLSELAVRSPIPLIFEGGLGTTEHVRASFRAGAAAVLMNTAFQVAAHPIELARAVRHIADAHFAIREQPQTTP